MPTKVAIAELNASSRDIINVIRNYAPAEYQHLVPRLEKDTDIPQIGQIFQGYPAMANYFLNALINRIALVRTKSAVFHNRFAFLKKGYLEYGETIEDIFIEIARVRAFDPEKAPQREFARTLPKVHTQFHIINWRVQYPITIQYKDLNQAFTSANGVTDFIERIIQMVYDAEEYDEYLLFKYLLIKAISRGDIKSQYIPAGDMDEAAIAYRAATSLLEFRSSEWNAAQVSNTTPRERQIIFLDARYAARFDVKVLAAAFNMDKTNFLAQTVMIDNWDTFDNDRFNDVRRESEFIEEVTPEELEKLKSVKAVIVDSDWFQVYDNLISFDETKVSSGMYYNYFLNVYKTISFSIFANAIAFRDVALEPIETVTAKVTQVQKYDKAMIVVLGNETGTTTARAVVDMPVGKCVYQQTEGATVNNIGVQPYGAYLIPMDKATKSIELQLRCDGRPYVSQAITFATLAVGDTVTFQPGYAAAALTGCVPNDNE